MATVNVGILTTAGKALVDRVNAGKTKVTYSKIVFSSMDNSALTDAQVKALTSITPADVTVSAPETTLDSGTGETKVRGTGDNQKLTSGVYIKTYGVYAKDDTGVEILYGVTVLDHPNYLVAFDGLTPQSVTYTYRTVISLTDNVTFTNGADIYTTEQDMSDAIGALDKQVVHDNHDGSIEVNGKSYVPANDAKVVHTSETGDWQKQKITTDSGGSILSIVVADNIDFYDRINQLPTGVYSFYCQGGVPHNPTGTANNPVRGLITVTGSGTSGIKSAFWYVFATDNLANTYTIYCEQGVYKVIKTADDSKVAYATDIKYTVLPSGTDLLTLVNNSDHTAYYNCRSINDATSMKNVPVSVPFELITRPVSSAWRPVGSGGYPAYNYTVLELRPYKESSLYLASITTDANGNISSTPWVKQANVQDTAKLQGKFDNLEIGGTNLLPETSDRLQTKTDCTGWGGMHALVPTDADEPGNYILRVWIEGLSHDASAVARIVDSKTGKNVINNQFGSTVKAGESGYSVLKIAISAGTEIDSVWISFCELQTDTSSISWKKWKLERDSVPTDWSPAPQDKADKADVTQALNQANAYADTGLAKKADDDKTVHINESQMFKTPTGDANTMTDDGVYKLPSAMYSNLPTNIAGGTLYVVKNTANSLSQLLLSFANIAFMRYRNQDDVWTEWKTFVSEDELTSVGVLDKGDIAFNADLNAIDGFGAWGFGSQNLSLINGPSLIYNQPRWGTFKQWIKGGPVFQLICTSQSEIYFRQKSGAPATWGQWLRVGMTVAE